MSTTLITRICGIGLTLVMSAAAATADAREQIWAFWPGSDGMATAVDCRDCPEDEYIRVTCTPSSPWVAVTILSVLVPDGLDKGARLSLTFSVDGDVFQRHGIVEFSEFFGAIPVAKIPPTDPLLDAIAAGSVLSVSLGGDRTDIPLRGSGAVLDKLSAACGSAN